MKKILFLFSIILLSACNAKSNRSDIVSIKKDTVPFKYIETFKHKRHFYISFGTRGIVHDPDCQYCYDKFD